MTFSGGTIALADAYWFQEGPGVRKWQFRTSGVKLLNVANVEKGGRLNLAKTERYLSESEVSTKYAHFLVDAGDLVIASSGISFDEDGLLRTRGAFACDNDLPLCLNTSTIRFKAVDGMSDLRFLRHWIDGREFRSQITRLVTGTAQQNFGPTHLKAIKITLPALSEQRRIAAILDKADALRAQRRAAIAQLDTLTQSIFLDMFGDPAMNPRKWTIRAVGDYVDHFAGGKSFETEADGNAETRNRVLKVSAVTSMRFLPEQSKPVPDSYLPPADHFIRDGDLLFSRANTTELVGAIAMVDRAPPNMLLPDKLWRFVWRRPPQVEPIFIWALFQTDAVRFQIARRATGTSESMKNISQEKLLGIRTILPPLWVQREFVRRAQSVENLLKRNGEALAHTEALFAALQRSAFSVDL